jgi:hypothetical protein
MGYPAHAANDLVQVFGGFFQHQPVLRIPDLHTADIQLDGGKQGAKTIMQIPRDPLALILPDGNLRKDPFPLQPHIPAVVADNGNKKVNHYCPNNYRKKNSYVKDLAFHLVSSMLKLQSFAESS